MGDNNVPGEGKHHGTRDTSACSPPPECKGDCGYDSTCAYNPFTRTCVCVQRGIQHPEGKDKCCNIQTQYTNSFAIFVLKTEKFNEIILNNRESVISWDFV